jgi:hypothetical protein
MTIEKVTVYCGSLYGNDKQIIKDIKELGRLLGKKAKTVLYGGGLYGHLQDLMDGFGETGGNMHAVLSPAYFDPGEKYPSHVTVIKVKDDEERVKAFLEGDAFVVTPGGDGTFAEAMFSHNRNLSALFLQQAQRPVVFMNTNEFYSNVIKHFEHMTNVGYSNEQRQDQLYFEATPASVIERIFP